MNSEPKSSRHYFVDEAGDTTLFAKGGKVLIGTPGCSRVFMLGLAKLPDPGQAERELSQLRANLLADPYFKGVPSMQPQANKTAICFHAKDDLPEVRREVFRLIASLGAEVFIAIHRKSALVDIAMRARALGAKAMIGPDQLYDDLVKRLFKHRLHSADHNYVVFAKRGKSARMAALASAINKAKRNFARHAGRVEDKPTDISALQPSQSAGLQVIDYYLWAIQRLYERQESRFFDNIVGGNRLIMDLDDRRRRSYGEWYDARNVLTLEKMKAL